MLEPAAAAANDFFMASEVTMKDVAAKAGVHHSTVSLCLKNHPRISASTRERVLKIARELGYRPHPYLTSLSRFRRGGQVGAGSPTIAFVTFSSTRGGWKAWMPELQDCYQQALIQARSRGFHLEEFWLPIHRASPRRLGEILYTRGIRAVLLTPLPNPIDDLDWQWDRLAAVALGPSVRNPRLHRVRNNHFESMALVMRKCLESGYKRVGLALKEVVNRKMEFRWLAPYLLHQYRLGIPNPPKPLLATTWTKEVFLSWLEQNQPDVVVAVNIRETTQWLEEAGFRIPRDIGLVSLSAPSQGRQTGVFQDWPMQGKRAVNLLMDLLDNNQLGLHDQPNLLLVKSLWNPGETIRPAKESPGATSPNSSWVRLTFT